MKIDDIRILLEKYQAGTCTATEQKIIEEWYASLQLGREEPLSEPALDDSLDRIHQNLQMTLAEDTDGQVVQLTRQKEERSMPLRPGVRWSRIAAAAVLILLCGTIWLLFFQHRQISREPLLASNLDGDTIVITSRGETRQIILSDGTTIQLNAGTEFRYPKRFSQRARRVELVKGEAFFQVVGDPARPFMVTTGQATTTVLGTSFNIRAYERDPGIQIALLTGKVSVKETAGAAASTLSPHQFIRIDRITGKTETGHFDNDDEVAAWREGGMHFKDASFADIAFEIGNKYNIELRNASRKQKWSYTGLFRSASLLDEIETICQTENLGYIFVEHGVQIIDKK
jgi:ferric-dicitrate binding protein FerR (iron transport regulator)